MMNFSKYVSKIHINTLIGDVIWVNMVQKLETITSYLCISWRHPDGKYENLQIDVVLPGVEKKDIFFKISENGFYIKASKEGVESADSY